MGTASDARMMEAEDRVMTVEELQEQIGVVRRELAEAREGLERTERDRDQWARRYKRAQARAEELEVELERMIRTYRRCGRRVAGVE